MSTRDDIADVLMRLSIHNVVNKNHALIIADTFVKVILDEAIEAIQKREDYSSRTRDEFADSVEQLKGNK